jgi:hypothetical protein
VGSGLAECVVGGRSQGAAGAGGSAARVASTQAWVTLFVEAYSRPEMGWALSLAPSSATVLAVLRMGLVYRFG